MRQELTSLLISVQLLKEENPGRKIAEIQGQLATVSLGLPGSHLYLSASLNSRLSVNQW